ncbi:hypothetical protein MANES_02G212860v8 [Manihot esculenta]|uniref:Uncharacterized protein n=1 Tax=Manihot esculenta TaxID=3983 RepID=A0ACB7I7T4_MANES|nr:hypothetical protein MANES_02G212860v8 [Manihot esculenta]
MASSITTNVAHASNCSLVSINGTQFSLKLTVRNYPTWRAQVSPLLKGHNPMGYVLSTVQIPPTSVTQEEYAKELSLCSSLVSDVDLVVQVLEGVGPEFHNITTAIHVHDTVISFNELQDKLLAHELYLKQIDPSYEVTPITANHVQNSQTV